MNRLTFFTDIAGRLARDVEGSPRVTVAAVTLDSARNSDVAARIPNSLPKWRACEQADANAVVELLAETALSVGILSVNKDTEAWRQFWEDSKRLHSAIADQDRRPAGFVRAANVLAFVLIGSACAIATGHALRVGPRNRILDYRGRALIERTVVCDSDISGDENLEVFRSLWERHDGAQPRMDRAGIRLVTREVKVTTEQAEPLLFLADYAAGLAHAALLPEPGRIRLPLAAPDAINLMRLLQKSGKVVVQTQDFEFSYREIFGNVMDYIDQ